MAWVKTKAWFRDSGITNSEWDCYSDEQKHQNAHWSDYRFNSDEIYCYNDRTDDKGITIWFKNGDSAMVDMGIAELDSILFPNG